MPETLSRDSCRPAPFTILYGKPVAACVMEISISPEGKAHSRIEWDAALQGKRPLEQGASLSQNLVHEVGAPLPDKAEMIAGIWCDGEPFGKSDWVKNILANPGTRLSMYEQQTSFVQRGLDQNWTRQHFLEALPGMSNSGDFYGIITTLEGNQNQDNKPAGLLSVIHTLSESLNHKVELIRLAKPPADL